MLHALRRAGHEPKRQGGEWHSSCPLCGGGKDRVRVHTLDGTLITQCRKCGADGPALWEVLGLFEGRNGGPGVQPLKLLSGFPNSSTSNSSTSNTSSKTDTDPAAGHKWHCSGPDGEAFHVFKGRDASGKKILPWEAAGAGPRPKPRRMVYFAGKLDSPVALFVEGEKSADYAGRLLPDWRIVGTVQGAPAVPDEDVLQWALQGVTEAIIWPDNDDVGRQTMAGIAAAVKVDVQVVNPGLLGLTGAGDDVADWPGPGPGVDAADVVREAASAEVADGEPLIIPGAEWVAAGLRPPATELIPDAPGLAYCGLAVLAHADRGTGKTVFATWLVTAALRAGLRVVVAADDDRSTWSRRLSMWSAPLGRLFGVRMQKVAKPGELETVIDSVDPDVVIIDSWRRWARACSTRGKGAMNDESLVGPVADRLVDVASSGPAVVILANQAKGQDGTTARGSASLEDAMTGAVRVIKRAQGGDVTEIATAGKVRDGVPAGPWRMQLTAGGFVRAGGATPPEGGKDPFTVYGKPDPVDVGLRAFLLAHPEGVSQRQIARAVTGRNSVVVARLAVLGVRGEDGKWRAIPDPPTLDHGIAGDRRSPSDPQSDPRPMGIGAGSPGSGDPQSDPQAPYRGSAGSPDLPIPEAIPEAIRGSLPRGDHHQDFDPAEAVAQIDKWMGQRRLVSGDGLRERAETAERLRETWPELDHIDAIQIGSGYTDDTVDTVFDPPLQIARRA